MKYSPIVLDGKADECPTKHFFHVKKFRNKSNGAFHTKITPPWNNNIILKIFQPNQEHAQRATYWLSKKFHFR